MNDHADRLNTWHLDLAITADALDHVLMAIEEPVGRPLPPTSCGVGWPI